MKRFFVTFVIVVLFFSISGCQTAPDPSVIQAAIVQTQAAYPTTTFYPTYTPLPPLSTLIPLPTFTPYPTYTQEPTQTPLVIVVTATLSPTPLFTPTITQTFTKTPIPSPTLSPLQMDKGPGIYLVNVDIAPGIWRNNGKSDNCYWSRNTKTGDIIDNHFGQSGGTIYIAPTDFQVTLKPDCGNWVFMGKP